MKYTVLGVCAGNGAVLWPFKNRLVGNIEPRSAFKTPGDEQWIANFPDAPLFRGVTPYTGFSPDVIIGHPDCGHSSVLAYSRGKKFSDPKENTSLTLYFKAIKHYKPKIFLFENLPALLKTYGEEDLQSNFRNYRLKIIQGSVSKFGNSQISRKRLVIVGVRNDLPDITYRIFKLKNKESISLSTFDALVEPLGSLNDALCHVRLKESTKIAMYGGCKMTIGEIKRGWENRPGEKRWSIPNNVMQNAPGVYRNLNGHYPLTVRKGNREFNNEGEIMSPRERAYIQGLPDDFKIIFSRNNPVYWINKGNITVTKCFPMEISTWFKRCLKKVAQEDGF